MSFCGEVCEILGRMTEARDDADVEDVPGAEASTRIVVRFAMQELYKRVRICPLSPWSGDNCLLE